jgi:hypothetical protein
MILPKYSLGIGDRFARQGRAQLAAVMRAREGGIEIAPVWNKSHREHQITRSHPDSVRAEADAAVRSLRWRGPYFVDADHITLDTVDAFIASSDFFTIDVADAVGRAASATDIQEFVARHRRSARSAADLAVPAVGGPQVSTDEIASVARKFLLAVREAGAIFRRIEAVKGPNRFVVEVSMDETGEPQTPAELFFILAALAEGGVPVQTIAPKFPGRFNKGVDYVGNVEQFERRFAEDVGVLTLAVSRFGLPPNLKLSVHSGSDKFSLYASMARVLRQQDAGLHLKTAGTTWLAEVAGLARAGGASLRLAQEIYARSYARVDELSAPYAAVIDIDRTRLPRPETVNEWSGRDFLAALRHDQASPAYNPHFRQLLHVGFRVAAEMGTEYLQAVDGAAEIIGELVTENLLQRHILPIFGAGRSATGGPPSG